MLVRLSRFWEIVFASVWAPSDGSLISSAAAVAKAIDVLSEYYSSAAFVQVHTAVDRPDLERECQSIGIRFECDAVLLLRRIDLEQSDARRGILLDRGELGRPEVSSKQPEFGGASSDVGSTIVSVLEVAESDFTTLSWRALLACGVFSNAIFT